MTGIKTKAQLRQALRKLLAPIDGTGTLTDDVVLQVCEEVLGEFHQ